MEKRKAVSNNFQKRFDTLLAEMNPGDTLKVPGRGGWQHEFVKTDKEFDMTTYNLAPDGTTERWFTVTTIGHPYGAPMFCEERTLRVSCQSAGIDYSGHIVGAMIADQNGNVASQNRFSWSNLVTMNHGSFTFNEDSTLTINGDHQGFVHTLIWPNKNRGVGLVAYTKLLN